MSDQIKGEIAASGAQTARRGIGFWALWSGAGVAGLLAASGGAVWFFLGQVDLGGFVARRASAQVGRVVQVGSLHVTPGRWLKVDLANARLANISGGTGPDMVRVGHLSAEVQLSSLLHGPVLVRHVALSDVYVMVERTPQRLPNWRFGGQAEAGGKTASLPSPVPSPDHASAALDDRSAYPTVLDAVIQKAEVIYRTAHGSEFRTTVKTLTLQTDGADKPVHLALEGGVQHQPRDPDRDHAAFFRAAADQNTLRDGS